MTSHDDNHNQSLSAGREGEVGGDAGNSGLDALEDLLEGLSLAIAAVNADFHNGTMSIERYQTLSGRLKGISDDFYEQYP